jgi:hypothetical protein
MNHKLQRACALRLFLSLAWSPPLIYILNETSNDGQCMCLYAKYNNLSAVCVYVSVVYVQHTQCNVCSSYYFTRGVCVCERGKSAIDVCWENTRP